MDSRVRGNDTQSNLSSGLAVASHSLTDILLLYRKIKKDTPGVPFKFKPPLCYAASVCSLNITVARGGKVIAME
jgi:hypothetical protein